MGKGARNEREAVDVYEAADRWVYRPETTQFGENDLWGLFDLAAFRPVSPSTAAAAIELVQVKSNRPRGITEWFDDAHPFTRVSGVKVHYAVRHDGQGGHDPTPAAWRLAVPSRDVANGYEWIVDERGEVDEPGQLLEQYLRVQHEL